MSGKVRTRIIDSDSDSDDNTPLATLRSDVVKKEAAAMAATKASMPAVAVKTEALVKREPSPHTAGPPTNGHGGSVKRERSREGASAMGKGIASGSDSDDNIPISSLAQRSKRVKVETTSVSKSDTGARRPTRVASPRVATPTKKKKRMKIKFKQQECTEELYETLKGRLVQELLCRWWYAVEWPPAQSRASHLHGVQELDGFVGSYIRVKGDDMGSIVDTRPQIGKPSFIHFFSMPAADIQRLLVKAYEKQMEVLTEREGVNCPQMKTLRSALASATKISPDKAERSVTKVIKKYKELADQIVEIQEKARQGENTATEEEEEELTADDEDEDQTADDDDDDDDE